MPAALTKEEAHAYIDSRPGWITLTTIGRDGMPHSIPIGYFRVGDDVYVGGRAGTQKIKNVERNPNVSVDAPVRRIDAGHQRADDPGHGDHLR